MLNIFLERDFECRLLQKLVMQSPKFLKHKVNFHDIMLPMNLMFVEYFYNFCR